MWTSGKYRRIYGDLSASGVVTASGTGINPAVKCPSANHTLYIQRVVISITTAAAQTITVEDTAGTPVPIAVVPASATGSFEVDFGDQGMALTAGKDLKIVNTAGPAYGWMITGYAKQTSAIAAVSTDSTF